MNKKEAESLLSFITSKVEEAWEGHEKEKIYQEYGEEPFDALDVVPPYLEGLHEESPPIIQAFLEEVVNPSYGYNYRIRLTLSPSAYMCASLLKCQLKECCYDWCFKPAVNKRGLKMEELRAVGMNEKGRTFVIYNPSMR